MTDEEFYIKQNYGTCTLEQCACLKPGNKWIGMECLNWKPVDCKTIEELGQFIKQSFS